MKKKRKLSRSNSARHPDRLYVDKEDRARYKKLLREEVFKDRDNLSLFLFAMAYGVANETRRSIAKQDGWCLRTVLRSEDIALMNAVAIYEQKSTDVMNDEAAVFKIAEEYAHAGIIMISNEIGSAPHGSYDKQLEIRIRQEQLIPYDQ